MSDWYDKIDDYLDNRLPDKEQAEMAAAIAQDPVLAHEVHLFRMEREALEMLKDEKARAEFLNWTEGATVNVPVSVRNVTWMQFKYYVIRVAAILVLGFGLWMSFRDKKEAEIVTNDQNAPIRQETLQLKEPQLVSPTEQKMPEKPFLQGEPVAENTQVRKNSPTSHLNRASRPELPKSKVSEANTDIVVLDINIRSLYEAPTDIISRTRGNANETEKLFFDSKRYFVAKDYQRAITLLAKVPPGNVREYPEALFLQAHAYFQLGEFEQAALLFHQVVESKTELMTVSKYMEAVSLFASGAKDKAILKSILEELKEDDLTDTMRGQILKMLDKLN